MSGILPMKGRSGKRPIGMIIFGTSACYFSLLASPRIENLPIVYPTQSGTLFIISFINESRLLWSILCHRLRCLSYYFVVAVEFMNLAILALS